MPSRAELDYLRAIRHSRDPHHADSMMFAQVNSEHCRHKIFNASWTIDGVEAERSLLRMIRHTQALNPGGVLSAYHDNAAVMRGHDASWFVPDPATRRYVSRPGRVEILMKVETHTRPHLALSGPPRLGGSRDEARRGRPDQGGVAGSRI